MLSLVVTRKVNFLRFLKGGVNFGSPYLGNHLSYRPGIGSIGLGLKNTVFLGVYSNSEIVNLSVLLPTVVKSDVFLKVF